MSAVSQLMLIVILVSCEGGIRGKIYCPGAVVTKVGCYADNYKSDGKGLWSIRPIPDLLFTDFEEESKLYSGIPWPNEKLTLPYIRGLICRCARNVLVTGSTMFGLQHYGECWSGKKAPMTYSKHGTTKDCITADLKRCGGRELCIGEDNANFIFTVKKRKNPIPTRKPTPTPSSAAKTSPKPSSFKTTPTRRTKPTGGDPHFEFRTTPCVSCNIHPGISLPPWREPYPDDFPPIYQDSYLELIGSRYYLIAMYFEEYVVEETFDVGSLEYLRIKWAEERQIKEIYQDYLFFEEVEVVNISKTSPELHKRLKLIMEIGIYGKPLGGSNYGGFGRYGGSYGTQYGSQHGGQYGAHYGGQYGSQYGNIHASQHGGQYVSQQGGQYGGQYGSQYGNIHASQHGGQYVSQHGGQYGGQYGSQYGNIPDSLHGSQYGTQYGIEYLYEFTGPYDPYSLRGRTPAGGWYRSQYGGHYGVHSPHNANYGKQATNGRGGKQGGRNANKATNGQGGNPTKGAAGGANTSSKSKLKRKKMRVLSYFKLKFKTCGSHLRTLAKKVGYGNIARVSEIVPHRHTGCCCCCNFKKSVVSKTASSHHVDGHLKMPSKCSCVKE